MKLGRKPERMPEIHVTLNKSLEESQNETWENELRDPAINKGSPREINEIVFRGSSGEIPKRNFEGIAEGVPKNMERSMKEFWKESREESRGKWLKEFWQKSINILGEIPKLILEDYFEVNQEKKQDSA